MFFSIALKTCGEKMFYTVLADIVLITHAFYVIFIVGGLAVILTGAAFSWNWVTNFWFRALHLTAIIVVTLQSWFEILCPLTTMEIYFRQKAGQAPYETTFIAHWLHMMIYYEAPMWVFSVCYTLFGLAVLASWIYVPPHVPWRKTSK